MKKKFGLIALVLVFMLCFVACQPEIVPVESETGEEVETAGEAVLEETEEEPENEEETQPEKKTLRLAVEGDVNEYGLFTELKEAWEEKLDCSIEVISADQEKFLELGEGRKAELFITEDFGLINAFQEKQIAPSSADIYENNLMILGPEMKGRNMDMLFDNLNNEEKLFYIPSEPGKINTKGVALLALYDHGGLQVKEIEGNTMDIIKRAEQDGAYVLVDQATYFAHENEIHLDIVAQGEMHLKNYGAVMVIPSDGDESIQEALADQLVALILEEETQKEFTDFRRDEFTTGLYRGIL